MRYNIFGFSQQELIKYKLDLTDALILRYFIDFKDSGKMASEKVNGEDYYWLKYNELLEQIPIINISSNDVLRRRLKKLVDCNILLHYTKKNCGVYSFYGIGANFETLIESIPTLKSDSAIEKSDGATQESEYSDSKVVPLPTQKSYPSDSKVGTKDSSIKDSSIKVNSSIKDSNKDIDSFFENVWNMYPLKRGKGSVKEKTKKELFNLGDKFKTAIERYLKDVELRRKDFPGLNYKNASTFFNSGYQDYIDDNFEFYEPKCQTQPQQQSKPIQSTNYDQREYDDDFFNSLYDNVQIIK